jgi:hypothetical protein
MTRVKTQVASVLAAGMVFGFAIPARAGLGLWPGDLSTTTTTTVGIGAAVFLLLGKDGKAEKADPEAVTTKATLLYLRDNHLQLVQDLAQGQGPVIQELASAAGIQLENQARFGRCMQAHAHELIELSAPEALDGHRTLRFLQRYLEIAGADQVLARDLLAVST